MVLKKIHKRKSFQVSYRRKGVYVFLSIGRKFYKHVPKTKRLRKKKGWFFCSECKTWFNRFWGSHGTCSDGGRLCNDCTTKRTEKILEKLRSK